MPCYVDGLDEDNDTSDEDSDEEAPYPEARNKNGLEFFINKEKKILKKRQEKLTETSVIDLTEIEE